MANINAVTSSWGSYYNNKNLYIDNTGNVSAEEKEYKYVNTYTFNSGVNILKFQLCNASEFKNYQWRIEIVLLGGFSNYNGNPIHMYFGNSSISNTQTVANWQWLGCYKSDWNNGVPSSDNYQENNSQIYFARGNVPIRGYIDFGKDPNMTDGIFGNFKTGGGMSGATYIGTFSRRVSDIDAITYISFLSTLGNFDQASKLIVWRKRI